MRTKPSFLLRAYHDFLAFIYAFTYRTKRRSFFGFPISGWIKTATLLLLVVAWIKRWHPLWLGFAALLVAWVYLAYWGSRRAGYIRFIPDATQDAPSSDHSLIPAYERIRLLATGVFTVQGWEEYLLLRPAEYWQVPLGDHIVMVRVGKERFLYQFFSQDALLDVQLGCLLFGRRLHETIAITFLESHHFVMPRQFNFAKPEDIDNQPQQKRTIYFTFADEDVKWAIWHNIVDDARRVKA